MSDYKGASVLLDSLPQARELLADRGYDAEWFRNALSSKGITPCIPGRRSRKVPVAYDKERIGAELPRVMTVVPIHSFLPFALLPLLSFLFNES